MSAIIAGRDADIPAGGEDDAKHFAGVAPGARIVNLKVGTADGAADVSQVIAAIDWAVQHRNSGGLNIRVINLSYGTRSTQSYTIDPLAHAVENAWRHGIVVVTAAGNNGPGTALSMPAADPYVIAVGAVDHVGTDTSDDDRVSDFNNTGTPIRRPDLLAPGKSVVSLRTPGSYADRSHPEGLVTGDRHQRFFRGSGTSQAAAVVSGAVALLLQQRPKLNPDQVKRLLTSTADRLKSSLDPAQGRGVLDIKGALEASTPSALWSRQTWIPSTGLGTLEASRGDNQVVDPLNGTVLTGEVDALGQPWDARSWSAASSAGEAWSGGTWNARSWSGADWAGSSWTARSWSSAEWTARSWSGVDWSARSWSDAVWTSSGWTKPGPVGSEQATGGVGISGMAWRHVGRQRRVVTPGKRLPSPDVGIALLVATMLAVTVGLFVALGDQQTASVAEPGIPWWLLLPLFALAEVAVLHVPTSRGGAHTHSLRELPNVLGLAFLAPTAYLLAHLAGTGAALLLHRRQRGTKLAFNLALVLPRGRRGDHRLPAGPR